MADSNTDDDVKVYLFGKTYLANDQRKFFIQNDPVVHMATGDRHTVVVTRTGRAFAFGDNSSGQLGHGHTNSIDRVSCIKSLKFSDSNEKVTLVACGRESSLVATNRGSLYAFGSNSRCQLAFDSDEQTATFPTPVLIKPFCSNVTWKQLAMGAEHACVLTADGKVYVWGSNEDGQCGLSPTRETVEKPHKLDLKYAVKAISCGYYHTAFVSEDGRLFLCGNNDDRQLGRSTPPKSSGPLEVSLPDRVKTVACGHQHTVVLTEKGDVYTCGRGDRGQLGLGPKLLAADTFELVGNLPKRPTDIAAGEAHTVVLGPRGDMYIFGDGKHGKLGSRTQSNEFEPCSMEAFRDWHALKAACGGCQTIVLTQAKNTKGKSSLESDEDIYSKTVPITERPKSESRTRYNQTLTDRAGTLGTPTNASRAYSKSPVRPSNATTMSNRHLRTEQNSDSNDDQSDPELSASTRSGLFNETHLKVNGQMLPTRSSFNQTTLRTNGSDFKSVRTGILDRTIPIQSDQFDGTKTRSHLASIDRSSPRNEPKVTKAAILDKDRSSSDDSTRSPSRRVSRRKEPSSPVSKPRNRRKSLDQSDDSDDRHQQSYSKQRTTNGTSIKPRRQHASSNDDDDDDRRVSQRHTIGARPADDNRNSFRSLAKPTATNSSVASSKQAAANEPQPGFFSRLFGSKSSTAAPPANNQTQSRACSIM